MIQVMTDWMIMNISKNDDRVRFYKKHGKAEYNTKDIKVRLVLLLFFVMKTEL
jgi:hypothetical protein